MKKSVVAAVLLSALVIIFPLRSAYSKANKSPSFLGLAPNARTRAMGNGLVGLAEGGSSVFYNPAGISGPKKPQVHSLYEPGFDQYSSFSLSFSRSNYGIAYRGLGTGEIIERDLYGQPTGDVFRYHSHGLIGGFGWKIGDIGIGIGGKGFYRSISDSYFGYSISPGLVYELEPFRFGAVLSNLLVSGVSSEAVGSFSSGKEIKVGMGFTSNPLKLGLDVKAELKGDELNAGISGAGLEWWISDLFAIRIGVRGNLERSFGFGIRGGNARIDYAYTFHKELPDSYVVSLGWVFE